jgi:hypothetical protein
MTHGLPSTVFTLAKHTPQRFVVRSHSATVVHIVWDNLRFTVSMKGFAELLNFLRGELGANTPNANTRNANKSVSYFATAVIHERPRSCLWLGKTGVILPSDELEPLTDMLLEAGNALTFLPLHSPASALRVAN